MDRQLTVQQTVPSAEREQLIKEYQADNNQLLAIMRSTAESDVPVWQVKYPNKSSKEHQGNHKG